MCFNTVASVIAPLVSGPCRTRAGILLVEVEEREEATSSSGITSETLAIKKSMSSNLIDIRLRSKKRRKSRAAVCVREYIVMCSSPQCHSDIT